MPSVVICSHTSSQRDSWWYLEQDADGSLHVSYENDDDHSRDWRKPINEFLTGSSGRAHRALLELVGRMFESR